MGLDSLDFKDNLFSNKIISLSFSGGKRQNERKKEGIKKGGFLINIMKNIAFDCSFLHYFFV